MRDEEFPVSRELAQRTLAAAKAARRKSRTGAIAVCSMALLTAAVAGALLFQDKLPLLAGIRTPKPTAAAVIGAPEPTDDGGQDQQPPPDSEELQCVSVPLEGGSYSQWKEEGIGRDGSYNLLVEPGTLDGALAGFALKAAPYDSGAAIALNGLLSSRNELRLVLETDYSCTLRLNAVGLILENGTVTFEYTDCAGENPKLYSCFDTAMGCKGFLVEIPPEAAGLPFSSRSVKWDGLSAGKKTEIMLDRILRNPDMARYLSQGKLDRTDVPELFLTKSPMETAGILSLGQEAADWMQSRCDEIKAANDKATTEYAVLLHLLARVKTTKPPAPVDTPIPTPEPAETPPAEDRSNAESAFACDLSTHVLSRNGEKTGADVREYASVFYLQEPLDSGSLSAAVLASVRSGGGAPTEPRLYIVNADYINHGSGDSADWELDNWTISPGARPSMDDYTCLRCRSWDRELYTLYADLNVQLQDWITKPFEPRLDNSGGQTATLKGTAGTLRWYRLSEWVQREKGAGAQNYGLKAADFPKAGAIAKSLSALSGGKWTKTDELGYGRQGRAKDTVGLQGVQLELTLSAKEGLWYYSYEFNPATKATALWRSLVTAGSHGGKTEYYICKDKAVFDGMMAALGVDTDVTGLLIQDGTPFFQLPQSRDELKYLVALVQDMPGGIAGIHPSIRYNGTDVAKMLSSVQDKSHIVKWAKAIGSVLGYMDIAGSSPMAGIDSLPDGMAAGGPAGSPALLKWDFDVAAQEGRASLTLYANPATAQVWSEVSYRLFGSTDVNSRYMTTQEGDKTLYLLLTELTFGKKIENPEDLPR